jgi:hypothetical protein
VSAKLKLILVPELLVTIVLLPLVNVTVASSTTSAEAAAPLPVNISHEV